VPRVVIAHRGASGTCPENTLAAFRRAAALGAHMIELDVQLTRDREVVVVHDWTLDRTTDGSGPVGAATLAEIRRLDAGAWFGPRFAGERVPTLAEVLAGVTVPVNVELKPVGDDGLEARALGIVDAAPAAGRVVFSSFDPHVLVRLRVRAPDARIGVLWEDGQIEEAVHLAERVGARTLHVRKDAVTQTLVETAGAAGLGVLAWTVNDSGESRRLDAAGVDGIFTDFPERFLQPGAPE
jgi:glycerophosphoryl diester phosphodiesterase